jgi:hypothetical protein
MDVELPLWSEGRRSGIHYSRIVRPSASELR